MNIDSAISFIMDGPPLPPPPTPSASAAFGVPEAHKMVLVVRRDLGMSSGKGSAALALYIV